ncbi:hypothetical protein ACFYY8_28700 [Streptosporangium sp. NPDC001559]|uniref:hypothetical protein n=1 Tax=Streptosporangium sp. NPDC001559 TaxID=3366187 RepID=UPI0036EB56F4
MSAARASARFRRFTERFPVASDTRGPVRATVTASYATDVNRPRPSGAFSATGDPVVVRCGRSGSMVRRSRRRFRPFGDRKVGEVLLDVVMVLCCLALVAGMLFMMGAMVVMGFWNVDMYLHGGRTTATAMSTRAVEQRTGEGSGTLHFTRIGFVVKDDRHVVEIPGEYAEGEKVSIIYDTDDPMTVGKESQVGIFALLFAIFLAVILLWAVAGLYVLWDERFR